MRDLYSDALVLSEGRYDRRLKMQLLQMEIYPEKVTHTKWVRIAPNVIKRLRGENFSNFLLKEVVAGVK
jgi:hypothetical protein